MSRAAFWSVRLFAIFASTVFPSLLLAQSVSAISISPAAVPGGATATGTVTLSAKAPTGGLTVTLTPDHPTVQVPATVSVPAGASQQTFSLTTTPVPVDSVVFVKASAGGKDITGKVTLLAPVLDTFSIDPQSVLGGESTVATLTITSKAPSVGTTIKFSSDTPVALVPPSVVVPAGTLTVKVAIPTRYTYKTVTATLTASLGLAKPTVKLVISPGDPLAPSGWPKYRGNAQNTGQGLGPTPKGILKWSLDLVSGSFDVPAIAPDGTVYALSNTGILYAFNADGTQKWRYQTNEYTDYDVFRASPRLLPDGTILFVTSKGHLCAVSPSGQTLWKYTIPQPFGTNPTFAADGSIYAGGWDGTLYAFTPRGTLKWTNKEGAKIDPVVAADGTIYTGSDFTFRAISPLGKLKWSYKSAGYLVSSPTIAPDGTVYIGLNDGNLFAFTPTGTLKWLFPAYRFWTSPAIASDGTVYALSMDRILYAVRPNGTKKWSLQLTDEFDWYKVQGRRLAVGTDGLIYLGGVVGSYVIVNPWGTYKASFKTGTETTVAPVVGPDGSIFVATKGQGYAGLTPAERNFGTLYAVSSARVQKWCVRAGYITGAPVLGVDGTVYVGSVTGDLSAVSSTGQLKWTYHTDGRINSTPTVGVDGTIYVNSGDRKLYAINSAGKLLWKVTSDMSTATLNGNDPWPSISSPAIGKDGTIYVGSFDGNLYAFNHDGSTKWKFLTENSAYGNIIASSPSIAADGTIYIVSFDTDIYAITPDGKQKWVYNFLSTGSSPAIGIDGTVYVDHSALTPNGDLKWVVPIGLGTSMLVGSGGMIYAMLDFRTGTSVDVAAYDTGGKVKWKTVFTQFNMGAGVITKDGTLLIAGTDGKLYANTKDGTALWTFSAGSPGRASATACTPALAPDGTLYYVSQGNILTAIR